MLNDTVMLWLYFGLPLLAAVMTAKFWSSWVFANNKKVKVHEPKSTQTRRLQSRMKYLVPEDIVGTCICAVEFRVNPFLCFLPCGVVCCDSIMNSSSKRKVSRCYIWCLQTADKCLNFLKARRSYFPKVHSIE